MIFFGGVNVLCEFLNVSAVESTPIQLVTVRDLLCICGREEGEAIFIIFFDKPG